MTESIVVFSICIELTNPVTNSTTLESVLMFVKSEFYIVILSIYSIDIKL